MDENRIPPPTTGGMPRGALLLLLGTALLAVAALTLTPVGSGWAWGSPVAELRWYATGLDSPATVRQLVGNVSLLVVPAALVTVLWPTAGRTDRLVALATGAGAGIELLQWALPLGRVVSPVDAALNAVGAVAAGVLARRLQRLHADAARGTGARPARSVLPATVHDRHIALRHN